MICEKNARVKRDKLCFFGAISSIIVLCMIDDDMVDDGMLDRVKFLSIADKVCCCFLTSDDNA
jgi:hypothetical protein